MASSTAAELSLVHLRNCLVNLPSSLVSLLVNVNTPAQNVVVQLSYRTPGAASQQQSVYVGWTGMPSKRKLAPIVSRDGINGLRGSSSARDQEIALVEIDATLANTLGLSDGQKVTASIHVDPPQVHTINLEPLTPEDWEIIELHATFLELNLLSQVRALPNPAFKSPSGAPVPAHPLTLHLSPTSSARIKTVSLEPPPPADSPFAKISPDAEVIVAPKTRAKKDATASESRSVASTSKSRRSAGSGRRRSSKAERRPRIALRGIDRASCADWFDEQAATTQDFSVWVDLDVILSRGLNGVNYVSVTVLREAGNQAAAAQRAPPPDEQAAVGNTSTPTAKVVANLRVWDDPPDSKPAALSSPLCAALGVTGMVGGMVEIEAASPPLGRDAVKKLLVFPFATSSKTTEGLKFGSESRAEKEEAAKLFKHIYGAQRSSSLLAGPVTDGLLFGVYDGLESPQGWEGGVVRFEPQPKSSDPKSPHWAVGLSERIQIEFQPPIPRPAWMTEEGIAETTPSYDGLLVSIDKLLEDLQVQLSSLTCTLLTGSSGSGKTSVTKALAQKLRQDSFFHTTYFSCKKLVNDESRMATIRTMLNQLFLTASWGAKSGGKALVILDDLDTSCPIETELQVGNDNGRSRQVSEMISSLARQYCSQESGVVLLATAEGKESLNDTIVGSNIFREVLELKSPNKESRRQVLEAIVLADAIPAEDLADPSLSGSRPTTADGSAGAAEDSAWMDGASQASRENTGNKTGRFILDPDLDFLDIAGLTDGYMPKDIGVVVERAQNEAIIRSVTNSSSADKVTSPIPLNRADFDNALKDFTPTSLQGVSLQSSTTSFSSIGGLTETRQILLETLLYPTKYAPVFEKCPLRLRSGLLLYGYPGCGKTLLASAVAGECGLNFISVKGPEILNKYIGASEKSVRDLFERASAAKPSVLFFDEFDSIAPKRGHDSTGVTDRVVNQLLTLMDGAEGLSGVYVLAATSRPDLIDPALLRPGRLDKSLLCDLPSLEDRVDILKALSQKVKLGSELTESDDAWTEIARRCESFSGADLQALISNAQLEAIHDVLHDGAGAGAERNAPSTNGKSKPRINGASKADSVPNFVQFPYEPQPDQAGEEALAQASKVTERASIVAKLEDIRQARRKTRRVRQPESKGAAVEDKEVVVGWDHLVKALRETKASISVQERARLQRIYHEFVVGRSGEMRDGQPSMEIGGRSSLM